MTLWWPLDGPDDPDGSPSPPTVLQITDPMGRVVTATVPEGLREGDAFSLPYVKQVPVAQGVVVARATPADTSGASPAAGGEGGG